MAAPVGISIQFDLPRSVIARRNLRASGISTFDRSSMNGSTMRSPNSTMESASTTCSISVKSLRRGRMASRLIGCGRFCGVSAGRSGGRDRARLTLAKPDEIDVARVDDEAGRLAEDENGVGAVDRISQQQNAAEEAEIPERLGDDARPRLLGGDPLHEKAHREQELREETDKQPDDFGARRDKPPMDKIPPMHL